MRRRKDAWKSVSSPRFDRFDLHSDVPDSGKHCSAGFDAVMERVDGAIGPLTLIPDSERGSVLFDLMVNLIVCIKSIKHILERCSHYLHVVHDY